MMKTGEMACGVTRLSRVSYILAPRQDAVLPRRLSQAVYPTECGLELDHIGSANLLTSNRLTARSDYYWYRTDNKKPPVTYRFLNLLVILDLSPGVSFYPSLADAN